MLIGLDHGGSNTTALVLDGDGVVEGRMSVPMPRRSPQPGWVEHDPEDFIRTSLAAMRGALEAAGRTWRDVHAVGIANQGETTMAWDAASGRPLGPALSWQDRRTTSWCEALIAAGHDDVVRERTGLPIDPYFAASKIRWLIDHHDTARTARDRGSLRVGGSDAYLMARLTGGEVHATDASTAARSALLDLARCEWDGELAERVWGVPVEALPEIRPTVGSFGYVRHPDVAAAGIQLSADVVDANAALFAHRCAGPQIAKATYGTGAFIAVNVGSAPLVPSNGLLPFVAWQLADRTTYSVEGGVFDVGSAIDWLVEAALVTSASATADMAASVSDSRGVMVVPSFSGLAAPRWQTRARGAILGMTLETRPAHLVRAALEGIACGIAEVVLAMEEATGVRPAELRADGGPTRNALLMQLQADILGCPVSVSLEPEVTAFGAALMAGIGCGDFQEADAVRLAPRVRSFEPRLSDEERAARWRAWNAAVSAVEHHAQSR